MTGYLIYGLITYKSKKQIQFIKFEISTGLTGIKSRLATEKVMNEQQDMYSHRLRTHNFCNGNKIKFFSSYDEMVKFICNFSQQFKQNSEIYEPQRKKLMELGKKLDEKLYDMFKEENDGINNG